MRPRDWPHLQPGAEGVRLYIARQLAKGYTGRIEIECNQGGVRWVVEHAKITDFNVENLTKSATDNSLT
jgi:hypothetical protein